MVLDAQGHPIRRIPGFLGGFRRDRPAQPELVIAAGFYADEPTEETDESTEEDRV